jgi:hypothetical protein
MFSLWVCSFAECTHNDFVSSSSHCSYRDNSWEDKSEHPLWVNETERTWKILQKDFSINRMQAWNISVFLRVNAPEIVKENQQSRCAPGFPCRQVAETTFKKMEAHLQKMKKMNEPEKNTLQKMRKDTIQK